MTDLSVQAPRPTRHLQSIDCVRGYAVLMVIACHVTYAIPELPYPVRRLTSSGWFGVELFFLASAITLLMSWRADVARGDVSVLRFLTRRLFRIAPAYYCAGLLYLIVSPPETVSLGPILWTALFVNSLDPSWLTAPGVWNVVPGSWSISVEFIFYFLFPLFAMVVTSGRRAVLVLLLSLLAGLAANRAMLAGHVGDPVISQFLFFWFPNQAAVFALGGVAYFLIERAKQPGRLGAVLGRYSTVAALGCIAVYCALVYVPTGRFIGDTPIFSAVHVISLPLAGFVVCLASGGGILVNRLAAAVGRVSFSMYLLHFAVLQGVARFPGPLGLSSTGIRSIGAFCLCFVVVAGLTLIAATVTYREIEAPMIRFGRTVTAALRSGRHVARSLRDPV